jgi:hypothetical protein
LRLTFSIAESCLCEKAAFSFSLIKYKEVSKEYHFAKTKHLLSVSRNVVQAFIYTFVETDFEKSVTKVAILH